VLTLEAAMSEEVHSRCSCMLDYERVVKLDYGRGGP